MAKPRLNLDSLRSLQQRLRVASGAQREAQDMDTPNA